MSVLFVYFQCLSRAWRDHLIHMRLRHRSISASHRTSTSGSPSSGPEEAGLATGAGPAEPAAPDEPVARRACLSRWRLPPPKDCRRMVMSKPDRVHWCQMAPAWHAYIYIDSAVTGVRVAQGIAVVLLMLSLVLVASLFVARLGHAWAG